MARDHCKRAADGHAASDFADLKPTHTDLDSVAFRTGRLSVGRFDRAVKGRPTKPIEVMNYNRPA